MATTIAHPRSVRSGPSGKTVAGFLAALLVALGVGYGITDAPGAVDATSSSVLGADRLHVQRGAELAARQAADLAETRRMIAVNENWGSFQYPMDSADVLIMRKGAEYAALHARVAEGERMLDINETWPVVSSSSAADFGLDGASHALPDYIRAELATLAQDDRFQSQIEFLTEQWNSQSQSKPEPKTPGAVE